jgi:ppGpp synthetase/RelA/SpoT-type nucleotidyltranferase
MVVADVDFRSLAQAYEAERPLLEEFVAFASFELNEVIAGAGIHAAVSGRAKDVDSFVVKALVGERYRDPLAEIVDKAGVRVVVPYLRDMARVEEFIREVFVVIKKEQKKDALAYNETGYLGIHLDVRLHDEQAAVYEAFADLRLEIQVRTISQGAWAEVTHDLLYKPPADLPGDLKRRIYRLVSLVELFDNEVDGFLSEAESTPGFSEAFAIASLSNVLLRRFDVHRKPDRQLSLLLAAALIPLYQCPAEQIVPTVQQWIDANYDRLRQLLRRADPNSSPLLLQPETFLILERLENDRAHLEAAWPPEIPHEWLEDVASAWGIRLIGESETSVEEE